MDYKKELEDAYKSILDAITENFKIHPDLGVKFVKDYNENLEALGKVLNQEEDFLETLGPFASDIRSAISAIKAHNSESFNLLISTIGSLTHAPANIHTTSTATSPPAVGNVKLVTGSPPAQTEAQLPLNNTNTSKVGVLPNIAEVRVNSRKPPVPKFSNNKKQQNKPLWRIGGKPSSQDGGGGDCGPAAIFASIITAPLAALIGFGIAKLGIIFGGAATVAGAATAGSFAGTGVVIGVTVATSAATWGIAAGVAAGIAIGMCVMMYIKCKIDAAENAIYKYRDRLDDKGKYKIYPQLQPLTGRHDKESWRYEDTDSQNARINKEIAHRIETGYENFNKLPKSQIDEILKERKKRDTKIKEEEPIDAPKGPRRKREDEIFNKVPQSQIDTMQEREKQDPEIEATEKLIHELKKIKNKPIVVAPRGLTANLNAVQNELNELKSVISEEALNKVLEELEQPFAKESANLVDKAISMFNHLYDEVFNRDKFDVTYHMRLSAAILKFASYLKGLKGLTKEEQDELEFLLIAKLKPSFNRALAYVNYLRVLPSRTDEQVKYAVRVAKQAASMLEYFTDESASLNVQIFNVLSMQAENILPIDAKLVVIYSMHNTNTKETLNTNMIANINLFKKEFIKNFLNKYEKTLPSTIFSEAIVVPFEGKDVEFPPKDYFISFSPEAVEFLNQLRTKKFKINPNAARIIRIFIDTYFNDPTNVEQITNIEQIKIFISITTNLENLINGLENNTWKDIVIKNPEGGKATPKKYHSTGQKITMTDKSVRTLYKDDKGHTFVKVLKNGKMICVPVKKKAARKR